MSRKKDKQKTAEWKDSQEKWLSVPIFNLMLKQKNGTYLTMKEKKRLKEEIAKAKAKD